ncbi:MAG: IS21 family transposase [Chloroflexi bacterium]|nr:IS21 family transposase [Chloroflexota bacterium]
MNDELRSEVLRRRYGGQSGRDIARELRLSRKTVAKVLIEHRRQRTQGTAPQPKPRPGRGSVVDAYEGILRDYLARYPDITVVRLLEECRARGYQGGYTVLRQRIKALRKQCRRRPVERFETGPAVQAQMDWATYTIDFSQEGRRKVHLFSYVLGYSRRQYIHFTASQDLETTQREHVRAFEHLGGCATTCLYDNMKVVVARYEDGEPIYNTRFLAFAAHYGFRPVACRPRRPQTKGKVERPFLYIEKNLLGGREFRCLDHLNEVAAWWLREVADVREHRQTRRRPIDMHAEEAPHLIPLPERAYEVAEMVYRSVDAEGFILYGNNRYSAPWHYLGQVLPVRITDELVTIYSPRLEPLAQHVRFPATERHRKSQRPEHLPPRDIARRREVLRERFAELGPLAVRFLEGLLAEQRCPWDHAQKALALLGIYRREDLLAALERAVRYGAFSAKSIERILAVQARPKTALDRMAEEASPRLGELLSDDPTPPRPATDYQHLLFEEPDHDDPIQENNDAEPETPDEPF